MQLRKQFEDFLRPRRANQRSIVQTYLWNKYGMVLLTESAAKERLIELVETRDEAYESLPRWLKWLNKRYYYRMDGDLL